MKKSTTCQIQKWILASFVLFGSQAFAVSPALTYHGRLLSPDGTPVATNVQFKIQIRSPGVENCLLWEETQTQDLSTTAGNFSVGINDGSGSRTDGGTNTFTQIFGNNKVITVAAGKCTSGTTYTPSLSDGRKMVVSFNDGSGWEDASAQAINYVPKAIDAMQVAGFPASSLLRFAESDGTLVGTTPLNNAQYTALLSLIAGTSNLYLKNSTTSGAVVPQVSGTPSTVTTGSIWFDTAAGALKFYDGSTDQTVGASSGTVSSIATGAALTGGPITTAGTIDMATLGAAGTGTKIFYDKYGRVTGTTTLAEADIPTLSAAGKVSGSAITSGTISGTAGVYTSGDVTATNVSSTHAKTRDAQFFDSATNAVTVKAPSILTGNYTLTLPTAAGSNGDVLTTDASGNLSWIAPTTGSVVSVSGTPPIVSSGGVTPTISIAKSDATHDGYLSSSDWSTFSSKLGSTLNSAQIWVGNASNAPAAVNLAGDLNLTNAGVATVAGIRGKLVSTTTPTLAGEVLRYDGTSTYSPAYLSLADIHSTVTVGNTMFPATPCTAAQTLTWSSLTDTMTCTTIAIADSAITYASQGANKILASPSAGTGTPSFRALSTSDLPTVDIAHGGTAATTFGANKVIVSNGTGAALAGLSCSVNQFVSFDASGYASCADLSSIGAFSNGGNAFGATANLGTKDSNDLNFLTATTTRMTISSGGNVGIGTTTPHESLEVAGNVRISTAPGTSTTLSSGVTNSDTTFPVASTTGYPAMGTLKVDNEYVTYASADATHFNGITRGANGTTAAAHSGGKAINATLLTVGAQTGSTPTFQFFNDGSFALGNSSAVGAPSVYGNYAIGNHATASGGGGAYAIGPYSNATGASSISMGYQTQATGKWATAIGYFTLAGSYTETVVGEANLATGLENTSAHSMSAPIFVVGNGTTGSVSSNALALFRNGQLIVNSGAATTSTSPSISSLMSSATLTSVGTTTDSTAGSMNAANSAGTSLFYVRNDGNVGIGTTSPGYKLSVAGDVNVTGNFRVNGTILSSSGGSTLSGITNISNSSGDITLAPATGTGAVQINSGTASTSSTTGALVVSGGIGVSGGINTGAAIVASGDITSLGNLYTTGAQYASQLYGTTTASGTVKIDGTSNATKGYVLLNSAGGNVGIGTTSPSSILSTVASGAKTASYVGNELTNTATSSTASISKIGLDVQSTGSWNGTSATNTGLNVNVSGGTNNYAATFQGGFVGIGTTTPIAPLHVQRDGIGTSTADGLYLGNTNAGVLNSGQASPAMHWATNAWDSSTSSSRSVEIKMEIPANNNLNSGNNIFSIAQNIGGGAWTNLITVNRYGNVFNTLGFTSGNLVGYTTVAAQGSYGSSATSLDGLVTQPPAQATAAAPVSYSPRIKLRGNAWDTGALASRNSDWIIENAPASGNPTSSTFSISNALNGSGTTTPLTILSSGNVGIGSTTPGYKLDVAGDVNASGCLRSSAGVASGSCVSDAILKTEVQTFDLGLDALMGVTPKTFKYNGLGGHPASEKPELGLIAQDVETTAPSLVGTRMVKLHPEDTALTEVKQVNYTAIPYVVINAVKQLYHKLVGIDREVASLKEENQKLKDEVKDLNTRLEKIEKSLEKK